MCYNVIMNKKLESNQIEEKELSAKPKSFVQLCKERYSIPKTFGITVAKTNFSNILVVLIVLFAFGLLNLVAYIPLKIHDLKSALPRIIYYSLFLMISVSMFIYYMVVKNKKNKTKKTIFNFPAYFTCVWSAGISLYNFFILGTPFNGFVVFIFAIIIGIVFFNYNPLWFLLIMSIPLVFMIPTIYEIYGLSGTGNVIVLGIVIFLLELYKRRVTKENMDAVEKQSLKLKAKTFGNFTLMYDDKVIKFQRKKSSELLAYLVYKNGSSVNSQELMTVLWGDRATSSVYGNSLRNLIVDIKHSLKELDIQNFFVSEYNNFRINPETIDCDYYNFLAGDEKVRKTFTGEFMSQFSWAEEALAFLERSLQITKV